MRVLHYFMVERYTANMTINTKRFERICLKK
jgi:hypothetical protein